MERRYAQFIAISLAIVLAGQLLQLWLVPKPARDRQDAAVGEAAALKPGEDPGAEAAPPSSVVGDAEREAVPFTTSFVRDEKEAPTGHPKALLPEESTWVRGREPRTAKARVPLWG